MRKKDDNGDYEPSPLRGTLASFERYLKGKKYGYSNIKDVEFEKARRTNKTSSSQQAVTYFFAFSFATFSICGWT